MSMPKKPRTICLVCMKETARPRYKYCSNKCQQEYEYLLYLQEWKAEIVSGLTNTGVVSNPVKRFLREKFNDRCCLCGWAEIHPKTGRVPLVADHIDGTWQNNCEENLRLLCPNCDSLTLTFAALNKGKGRANRAVSKRSQIARALL